MREVIKYTSPRAAEITAKYSNQIADQLFKIARVPDLTVQMVKGYINQFLTKECKVSSGYALEIADGVARALNVILF